MRAALGCADRVCKADLQWGTLISAAEGSNADLCEATLLQPVTEMQRRKSSASASCVQQFEGDCSIKQQLDSANTPAGTAPGLPR